VGTVLQDDPQLTVRMVPGASPTRVVLDSTLRLPPDARVLDDDATTIIVTTERSDPERRAELRRRGVAVEVVGTEHGRVALAEALGRLRSLGLEVLMVEGGAEVITGLLQAGLVDRLVVAVAPMVIGSGTSAVEALGITRIADAIRLSNRSIVPVGDDVLLAWDVAPNAPPPPM